MNDPRTASIEDEVDHGTDGVGARALAVAKKLPRARCDAFQPGLGRLCVSVSVKWKFDSASQASLALHRNALVQPIFAEIRELSFKDSPQSYSRQAKLQTQF